MAPDGNIDFCSLILQFAKFFLIFCDFGESREYRGIIFPFQGGGALLSLKVDLVWGGGLLEDLGPILAFLGVMVSTT